jgi:predicted dehydrogenase
MSQQPIRFALVGCGSITKKHIQSLRAIEDAAVVAVCDRDEAMARKVGEEYRAPWYSDCHEMAAKEEFDVFSVLTPSGTHAPVILDLVQYGRNFVVEKPLALRIVDADQVITACEEKGVKLYVVQQNRYNLPIVRLKEAIAKGRFGKMVMGTVRVRWCRRQEYYDVKPWRGTWAQDGGALTNQASHFVDMLAWLMGDVQDVMAMTATRLAKIEAEDTGVAILRFTSGALGVVEATTCARPKDMEGSISIMGEKGAVEIGGFYMNKLKTWQFEEPEPEDETVFETHGQNPDVWAWNHQQFLKDVIACQRQGVRGMLDGLEGRRSLELINAIYESSESGQRIPLKFMPRYCRLGIK